jgi:hypothetical protein
VSDGNGGVTEGAVNIAVGMGGAQLVFLPMVAR